MIQEEEYKNYTLDDWIDLFKQKIKNADTEEECIKYEKALDLLDDIKNSNNVVKHAENITDDVYIYIKLISDAFTAIFNTWEYTAKQIDNVIVLYNDVVCIDLFVENSNVNCIVSFGYNTSIPLVAEITKTLNDIFSYKLNISENIFYINELNDEFIWGIKNINEFKQRQRSLLNVKPILVFDDKTRGNC